MPRKLIFKIGRTEYETVPVRVDRRKLYGWTELTATDENGIPCELLSADESGKNILPPGGTAAGIVSDSGRWVERSELRVVDAEGKTPKLYRSNFNRINRLNEEVTPEEFLEYSITDIYHLTDIPDGMAERIGDKIFRIEFTYHDSYDPSPAFILAAGSSVFLLAGLRNRYEMLCFEDCESVEYGGEDETAEDENDIDFSMF